MSSRVPGLFAACQLLLACAGKDATTLPPTGQVVLYVTTDAPLPPAPGERADPNAPPALFDRLRVDVFAPGAQEPCQDCSREFELDRIRVRNGEASFGIVPRPGATGYVARARLYRAITVTGGEPPRLSTIEVYAALPAVSAEGIVKATIELRVNDVGHSVGSLSSPSRVVPGEPDFSQIRTWPNAMRVPCANAPSPGEACVPGGAFWLGHPQLGFYGDGTDASETRLVVVSPFYVDLHEVTVAEFRASGLAKLEMGSSIDPSIGPPEVPPAADDPTALRADNEQFFCDYSDVAFGAGQSREQLALNCVSWSAASAYCTAHGKTLPSEAQFEYVSSGLRSELFLWGQDAPKCADSVWGNGGVGAYLAYSDACRPKDAYGGPLAPGNGRLDRLALTGGEVLDLIGNLNEWTRDHWNRTSEPCWAGQSLLINPECTGLSIDGDYRTVKGGSWNIQPTPAAIRKGQPLHSPPQLAPSDSASSKPASERTQTGFRCVRPAR